MHRAVTSRKPGKELVKKQAYGPQRSNSGKDRRAVPSPYLLIH